MDVDLLNEGESKTVNDFILNTKAFNVGLEEIQEHVS